MFIKSHKQLLVLTIRDASVPAWNLCTRNQGWYAVGMSWEYHAESW
jgi:hypothetical protein